MSRDGSPTVKVRAVGESREDKESAIFKNNNTIMNNKAGKYIFVFFFEHPHTSN